MTDSMGCGFLFPLMFNGMRLKTGGMVGIAVAADINAFFGQDLDAPDLNGSVCINLNTVLWRFYDGGNICLVILVTTTVRDDSRLCIKVPSNLDFDLLMIASKFATH